MKSWIFDAYPEAGGMRVWTLDREGRCRAFLDPWRACFYLEGSCPELRRALDFLGTRSFPVSTEWAHRSELFSGATRTVLEVRLPPPAYRGVVGVLREMIPELSFYNADIHLVQAWHYERGHFPTALCEFETDDGALRSWTLRDDPWTVDYELPPLRAAHLCLTGSEISGALDPNHAPRGSLSLACEGRSRELEGELPEQLESLSRWLTDFDPDILTTDWGDSWLIPMLQREAERHRRPLPFSRDPGRDVEGRDPRSFMTYGRTVYQSGARCFFGRWHLDLKNSFTLKESGMPGLLEVARIAKIPVQRCARTTIGTALSSMQLDRAWKDGILIPMDKQQTEDFRPASELIVADKGGLAYEPEVGWFEQVAEYDFVSMYPTLMVQANVSPETVNCACCPDNKVPEIGHHLCRRREGLVPKVLKPILEKRARTKARAKAGGPDAAAAKARANAHKWILVCCFEGGVQLPFRQDGRIRIARISDVVDPIMKEAVGLGPPEGRLEVVGVDAAMKSRFRSVKNVIRLPAPENMLDIRIAGGRDLRITPDHTCCVLRAGRLDERRADALQPGDYVPVLADLPASGEPEDSLDLIQIFLKRLPEAEKPLWRAFGKGMGRAVAKRRDAVLRAIQGAYSVQSLGVWERGGFVPLQLLPLLGDDVRVEFLGRGRRGGGLVRPLRARLALDRDLGWLLGFYAGDGSSSGNMVRFGVGMDEADSARCLKTALRRVFGLPSTRRREKKARMWVVQVNSVALRRVLEVAFRVGPASDKGKLVVPDAVLNGPASIRRGFLEGLLASDGSVSKSRRTASWISADRAFIRQVGFLMGMEGLQHRYADGDRLFRADLRGPSDLAEFSREGAYSGKHQSALRREPSRWSERRPEIPVRESGLLDLARRLRAARKEPRIDNKGMISRETAFLKLAQLRAAALRKGGQDGAELDRIEELLESGLVFAEVRSIRKAAPRTPHVYCVELEAEPRWIASEGGILTSNCFGYLGFKNARFGKIEAHECVTALGRDALLKAKEIVEGRGLRLLHALVDAVWVTGSGPVDWEQTRLAIEAGTGCRIGLEGVYKWLRFCPSKRDALSGVPGRYFGAFTNGELKIRGIASRRRDTPKFLKALQGELLALMAGAKDLAGLRALAPRLAEIAEGYRRRLREGQVTAEELAIAFHLSKEPGEYVHDTVATLAARQLQQAGASLHPGETVRYVITSAKDKVKDWRARPLALMEGALEYDPKKYLELLERAVEEVTAGL